MDVKNKDLLIIRIKTLLTPAQLDHLKRYILEQRDAGVIGLPSFCEVMFIPGDTEIKIEASVEEA